MAAREKNDLGYLGEDFQLRLIHTLMSDDLFFRDIFEIVDQNMFTVVTYRTYVMLMKNYYQKHLIPPSYDVMGMVIMEKVNNDIEREELLTLNKELPNVTYEAIDYVKELATRFFKQQNIVRVANEILQIAGNGDVDKYDICADLINQAVNVGVSENYGEGLFDNLDETLSDENRSPIPTGIDTLDKALHGGIGHGELGVIIAPSGAGKTSLTTSFANTAACNGFKVLQIFFEDKVSQIRRKHIGKLTGIESCDLSLEDNRELAKQILANTPWHEQLAENLRMVRFPTGEITAQFIENYINKQINMGFKPDLVIVDYFECLKYLQDKTSSEWTQEGVTMRKFESMANKLNIAFWIPVQGSRESISSEVVTMDKGGGSLKKIQIAHILISIARTQDDVANNRATFALLKNRAGGAGAVWSNVYFNNGTCTINTDEANSFNSDLNFSKVKEEEKEVDKQKLIKSLLRQSKQFADKKAEY